MVESFGQQALVHIFVNLVFLVITWWALTSFKFDLFVKDPDGPKAKALVILLTIAIAHLVSSFFLDYLNWSTMLRYLF
ncbi:DUF1146 family protein [Desertibacillus haloalkaliphilus]|uniref:DUF1146 family protein n=1 Tax=Desertibacillus haloalkaliphilus TaxID=1328930 RepID=UPI001C2575F2|nr:DUF1146 family protein [Desertibacillus haloalkaliphilus]MBU8905903.1 DUF1146 family protein [Desertibacillus haloalkaliphilus]